MPLDSAAFSDIVDIYGTEIASLINNLGKDITLYFEPEITNVADTIRDKLGRDLKRPIYKETSKPTITTDTLTVKALLKYNPKDYKDFGLKIDKPNNVLRVKTFLHYAPDLMRCQYIIPSQSTGIIDSKYKLIREVIPVGLQKDRFCLSFWERL